MGDWELCCECEDAEEEGWQLIEAGALGLEILSAHRLRAFFQGSGEAAGRLREAAVSFGFREVSLSELPQRNWVQECSEVMVPMDIGVFRIVPVTGVEGVPYAASGPEIGGGPTAAPQTVLYLIPGAGFGTGHHVSTEMMLKLMQAERIREVPPRRVLDIGTGSGILAIAARRLYGSAVDAVDIDERAIENARDNAAINQAADGIRFGVGSAEKAEGVYDLVVANLYAELLMSFREGIEAATRRGSVLIVSGITADLWAPVEECYLSCGWLLERRREELGWYAALFRRS